MEHEQPDELDNDFLLEIVKEHFEEKRKELYARMDEWVYRPRHRRDSKEEKRKYKKDLDGRANHLDKIKKTIEMLEASPAQQKDVDEERLKYLEEILRLNETHSSDKAYLTKFSLDSVVKIQSLKNELKEQRKQFAKVQADHLREVDGIKKERDSSKKDAFRECAKILFKGW